MRAGILGLIFWAMGLAAGSAAATVRVVTTTTDLAALAAAVGGDSVIVESIVPAGVDPEAFEPRPDDLNKLRRADLIVRVGLGYDYWLDALINRVGDPRLMRRGEGYVDASTGIPLLEVRGESVTNEGGHAHGVANPHYWLDPGNAIIITANISEALIRIAPGQRDKIVTNREAFLSQLKSKEPQWSTALAPYAATTLIAYHNAWPYLARRFRLDVVGFIEPKAGVAPSPAHLARLIADGRNRKVRAIIIEPHEPDDAARFVAGKLAVPVVRLAISVGSVEGTGNYIALIDHNVTALANSLAAR